MNKQSSEILEAAIKKASQLESCKDQIINAYDILIQCFENGGKLLVCGNGGSAADSEHIVGELMKGFLLKRPLETKQKDQFAIYGNLGQRVGQRLQGALPAFSLVSAISLISAISNDTSADMAYAQQVWGLGKPGDVLLGISTSGNAENIICAMITAKASGMKVIGLSGESGGKMSEYCDILISVPAKETFEVQELHLPVYHTLCAMLEAYFFSE